MVPVEDDDELRMELPSTPFFDGGVDVPLFDDDGRSGIRRKSKNSAELVAHFQKMSIPGANTQGKRITISLINKIYSLVGRPLLMLCSGFTCMSDNRMTCFDEDE